MKKQLLTETEIRQFMKFANIGALASPFVDRLQETYEMGLSEVEEDDLEAVEDAPVDDTAVDDTAVDDLGTEEDPDAGPTPDEGTNPALQGVMDAVEAMKLGFVEKGMPEVADAIGLSATGGEEEAGMTDPDAPMSVGADELAPSPDEGEGAMTDPDAPMSVGPDEQDELDEAGIYLEDDGDIVNEVARRVARRLLEGRRRRKC